MVTQCAVTVKLTHVPSFLGSARHVRALLSPTMRTRVSLVDQRKTTWDAVKSYLKPVTHELSEMHEMHFEAVAWQLYMVCLASKHSGERS